MTHGQDTFSIILPQQLWTAEQVRLNEPLAAAATGVSMAMLMERAGEATFDLICHRWPEAKSLLVLAGRGNNGGDAYVVASLAHKAGLKVQLVQVGDPGLLTDIAADARDVWLSLGCEIDKPLQANLSIDLIVDGLLGTGLKGAVRGEYSQLIDRCNYSTTPIIAIDIPSGLDADTGCVHGAAIKADASISFVGIKQGMCNGQASEYCGQLYFAGLGIDKAFVRQGSGSKLRISYEEIKSLLAPRNKASHKGNFGRVALIGGNKGMPGAIRLAAEACLRAGAGLASVITHSENIAIVCSGRPELMVYGLADPELMEMASISGPLNYASVLVIGPGLGQDKWAKFIIQLALKMAKPKVVDADALNYLAQYPGNSDNWVLTPHPGEAARLLGISLAELEADRYSAVRHLQKKFGGVVVLKGPGTLICGEDKLLVANVGNPGMASGGMGDLLSGLIAALLGQGLSLIDAAAAGVCIHGNAADLAAKQGERGMLASDLLPHIRKLVNPVF